MTIEALESALGYSFQEKSLLHKSLAHSSYINEHPDAFNESNERLEFLGDSILGHVVASELFLQYPSWSEGELTRGRSALVNGAALAKLSCQLGLGELLYMGNGEEKSGGRMRPNNLAAVMESVIGAAFLDGGYAVAHDIIMGLIREDIQALGNLSIWEDPKSSFQEAVSAAGLSTPIYRIVKEEGADHLRAFTAEVIVGGKTIATGAGSRKNLAEREAAKAALVAIKDL